MNWLPLKHLTQQATYSPSSLRTYSTVLSLNYAGKLTTSAMTLSFIATFTVMDEGRKSSITAMLTSRRLSQSSLSRLCAQNKCFIRPRGCSMPPKPKRCAAQDGKLPRQLFEDTQPPVFTVRLLILPPPSCCTFIPDLTAPHRGRGTPAANPYRCGCAVCICVCLAKGVPAVPATSAARISDKPNESPGSCYLLALLLFCLVLIVLWFLLRVFCCSGLPSCMRFPPCTPPLCEQNKRHSLILPPQPHSLQVPQR